MIQTALVAKVESYGLTTPTLVKYSVVIEKRWLRSLFGLSWPADLSSSIVHMSIECDHKIISWKSNCNESGYAVHPIKVSNIHERGICSLPLKDIPPFTNC